MFSSVVTDHWTPRQETQVGREGAELPVVIDDALPDNRSIMVLELAGGGGVVTLTTSRAASLGLTDGATSTAASVLHAARRAGLEINDPDHLYYLPSSAQRELVDEVAPASTRRLGEGDADLFGQLQETAPAADLDEAFVELDHWLVFGSFEDGRLVCAASMFPWRGTQLADLGVITLPSHRGRGLGRRTARAISAHALAQGYEPQYRCQVDNHASIALAAAAGFVRYGTWHVIESVE